MIILGEIFLFIVMRPIYEDLRQFFSKFMPLAELYIYHPSDVYASIQWEVDLLIRMVSTFYGKTLGKSI